MSTAFAPATTARRLPRRLPRRLVVSAWAAPVMVVGDFALMAVFPVVIALVASLRDPRARALRWPTGLLAAVYARFSSTRLDPLARGLQDDFEAGDPQ